jgi:hypothetical protein
VTARLASSVFVSALTREVNVRGGTAAVIAKGDPTAGSLLLLCAEKGQITGIYDYILNHKGHYVWVATTAQPIEKSEEIDALCARRVQIDPDLWIVELDIPNAERFIADFAPKD